jgi:hypothetical protein
MDCCCDKPRLARLGGLVPQVADALLQAELLKYAVSEDHSSRDLT